MLKALLFKELRETLPVAALALVAYAVFLSGYTGHNLLGVGYRDDRLFPFLFDYGFTSTFVMLSAGLAIGLGIRQTAFESRRGTWLFLLHRPLGLRLLIGMKLATGAAVYLLCAALPVLAYAWWAATPGTHASPFYWWMTADVWKAWIAIVVVYLGAFLAGIRPGRWVGTRLLPLAGAGLLAGVLGALPWWLFLGLPLFILVCPSLVTLILFVARTRDFS